MSSVIDVHKVIDDVPHFENFCSVEKLHELIEHLRTDPRFSIEAVGTSGSGIPIHHVRFGTGSVKALFVGGPHCMEPIGSLTVFSLMSLLSKGNSALVQADIEWHIVPCLDPDGALLNEGWTQKPYTVENYIRYFYLQPRPDQVDFSFPITHKELIFNSPSKEAKVLKGILDRVQPDFFFSLHNFGPMGGTWYALSRDIGPSYYRQIRELMEQWQITLQPKAASSIPQFSDGMRQLPTIKSHYDRLEQQRVPIPEEYLQGRVGASSVEYLLDIKPGALVFVAELPYGQHPGDASEKECSGNLRQLKLRIFADNKFLASLILEEWEKVKEDFDVTSPFYRKVLHDLVEVKDTVHEGVTEWYEPPIRSVMFSSADGKSTTERDCIHAYSNRVLFLGNAYTFVRLLKSSKQTPAMQQAIERLDRAFDEAVDDIRAHIDFSDFEVTDCDRLTKVQLGSGLIALNSLLATQSKIAAPSGAP